MAKKQTEMNVEEKLKTLFQLQTALSEIDEKRAMRGELPLEVKDLEDEIEGMNTRREKIQGEIQDYEYAVDKKQGDIRLAQDSLDRYKKQLDDVRNNREYDTLTKEIEFQSLEVELCNKKIKEAQIKIEEKKQELAKTTEMVEERTKDLIQKRSELDEIMQETRDAEESLREKAHELEVKIEPRLLTAFKRIRKSARNGLGIVYVQRDACGGCFAKIPPQRQIDIMMHKKVIVCEYCGRILVDPELAGVEVEQKVEEKPKRQRATTRKTAKAVEAAEPAAEA